MPNGMRWVGLDVHAHASAVAVFDDSTGEVITRRVCGRPWEVLDVLRELPRPLRAVYEAGPTGYGLVRRARAEGIEMAVCSPGNIERRPGDRIKTDKRDAIRLARLLAAGELRLVWIPSEEQEQLRDLVRCREDLRADLMRARHRLGTFLLRRERYYPGARRALDGQAPPLALPAALRRPGVADHLRRLSARPRRPARAPRPCRARARTARPRLRVGRDDRAAALLARDQHPDRARAVRRDRRLAALRTPGRDRQLRRPGPLRIQLRPEPAAGQDHQGRLQARSPTARRGRAALPPHAGGRRDARAPPARPGPRARRPRLARAATAQRALEHAAHRPRQASWARDHRDRA